MLSIPLLSQELSQGQLMLENKQYHQAVKFFSEFLINNPENVEALNGLAEGQHRSGDPMTAILTYQKSLLHQPDQPEAWISIGNIQYYNNLFLEATLSYQKSAELDSTPRYIIILVLF